MDESRPLIFLRKNIRQKKSLLGFSSTKQHLGEKGINQDNLLLRKGKPTHKMVEKDENEEERTNNSKIAKKQRISGPLHNEGNFPPSNGKLVKINSDYNLPPPKENTRKSRIHGDHNLPSTTKNNRRSRIYNDNNLATIPTENARKPKNHMHNDYNLPPPDETTCHISNDMRDACKTLCKICDQPIPLAQMRKHTLGKHDLQITKYKEIHGPFLIIDIVYHKCQLCGTLILLDSDFLGAHIKNIHKIKEQEYNDSYMIKIKKVSNKWKSYKDCKNDGSFFNGGPIVKKGWKFCFEEHNLDGRKVMVAKYKSPKGKCYNRGHNGYDVPELIYE